MYICVYVDTVGSDRTAAKRVTKCVQSALHADILPMYYAYRIHLLSHTPTHTLRESAHARACKYSFAHTRIHREREKEKQNDRKGERERVVSLTRAYSPG